MKLLAFAAGIAIGYYLGLRTIYSQPPTLDRDDDEPIAPADPYTALAGITLPEGAHWHYDTSSVVRRRYDA